MNVLALMEDPLFQNHLRLPNGQGILAGTDVITQIGRTSPCGDEVLVYAADRDGIFHCTCEVMACSIGVVSASLMTALISSQPVKSAAGYVREVCAGRAPDSFPVSDESRLLGVMLHHLAKSPRIRCLLLPWKIIEHIFSADDVLIKAPVIPFSF